jgi:hypothetical protein
MGLQFYQGLQFYLLGGKPPKAREPLLWTDDQQTTKTDRLTAEELKYSHNKARQRRCPSNDLLEVWQSSAPFGGRPIGTALEALLTKVLK